MTKPLVILDCDGVLADFVFGYLAAAQAVLGRPFHLDQVNQWNIPAALGLTSVEAAMLGDYINGSCGFCETLPPYPGAIAIVDRIRRTADVIVATSPWPGNPWWMEERTAWLDLHFGIQRKHVIHVESAWKHLIRADVFVDDRPDTIDRWAVANPSGTAVLFAQPYNAEGVAAPRDSSSLDPGDGSKVTRTRGRRGDWADVLQVVERLA